MDSPQRIVIPVPFAITSVNAWYFSGDTPALVDCGIGSPDGRQQIVDEMRSRGAQGLDLFITHGHVDHAGNAGILAQKFAAKLHAPRAEEAFIETFRRDEVIRNDRYAQALAAHGMPQEHVAWLRARSSNIDEYTDDCPIAVELPDTRNVVLGEVEATAYVAPGHTPGSTVFATEDNDLLSGDTLLQRITSNAIELLDEDQGRFHDYLKTIERLRKFVGYNVLPGHHDPFTLTDEVIDYHLEKHEKRAKRIVSQLQTPKSAWQILPRVFPPLEKESWFLAMSDIVGHLHALELDGRIKRTGNDPVQFAAV